MFHRHLVAMKSANIAELKNRLSHYLRFVRRGETVLIKDRDQVIARIEPVHDRGSVNGTDRERIAALVSRGVLVPPQVPLSPERLGRRPKIRANLANAVLAEREEGR